MSETRSAPSFRALEVLLARDAAIDATQHKLIGPRGLRRVGLAAKLDFELVQWEKNDRRIDYRRVELDDACFKTLADFDARFPHGPPSLVGCTRLRVEGDVRFGADVVVEGEVRVRAEPGTQREVPAGTVLRPD